ncbi:MAG: hypothetical protein GXY83_21350 [Rhodopirellula sp.]|nr:hypothetical protein [Rhodopirellula sp.]
MQLVIDSTGVVRCLYHEGINLSSLGRMVIVRGSHVEPDESGRWHADLSPVNGPRLGPFERRSLALEAEVEWLQEDLTRSKMQP